MSDELFPDIDRPNVARMYDYMLGGAHNFAVDRDAVDRALADRPDLAEVARANRSFLGRVVGWCLEHGIDQFVDLGSGVPTVGNVHEVAHTTDAGARVVYVDVEPIAVSAGRQLVAGLDTVAVLYADLCDSRRVLGDPVLTGTLDLSRPVALLAVAVLHFVDGDLAALLGAYRRALAPGSIIALSHGSDDVDDPELAARVRAGADAYRDSANPTHLRSRADLVTALGGPDRLVPPGLVDIRDWPDTDRVGARTGMVGAVATV